MESDSNNSPTPIDEEEPKQEGFYRITFDTHRRDYFTEFCTCPRDMYPTIKSIIDQATSMGIEDIWWFFEPYAEVTWYAKDDQLLQDAMDICEADGFDDPRVLTPNTKGRFYNWYGSDDEEIRASARTYAEIRKTSQVILDNADALKMGRECHYQRSLHVLANQLGLNYFDEGWASLKHGALCMAMFWLNTRAISHVMRRFGMKNGLTCQR